MKVFVALLFVAFTIGAGAQAGTLAPPAIEWQHCYGTTQFHERLTTMTETRDGGYLLGGVSSDLDDGYLDWFVVRVDASGQQLWFRTFGGSSEDELESLAETRDGGFILPGVTGRLARGGAALAHDPAEELCLRVSERQQASEAEPGGVPRVFDRCAQR